MVTEGPGLVGTVVLLRREARGGGIGALCALEGSRWETGEGLQQNLQHGTQQLLLVPQAERLPTTQTGPFVKRGKDSDRPT